MTLSELNAKVKEAYDNYQSLCSEREQYLITVAERFYDELVSLHNFSRTEEWETPGNYGVGVVNQGVEVVGVHLPEGVRIDISIPIDMQGDHFFRRLRCAGSYHLGQAEELYLRDDNLTHVVERTVEIAKHGMELRAQYIVDEKSMVDRKD